MKRQKFYKKYWFPFTVVIVIVAFYAAFLLYITWPITIKYSIDKAGVFGDSFGVINTLFTGLAFAGVISTLFIQREDIKIQRENSRHQSFETSFYKLISLLRSNLKDLSIGDDAGKRINGVSAIRYMNDRFDKKYKELNKGIYYDGSDASKYANMEILFKSIKSSYYVQTRYLETFEALYDFVDRECPIKEDIHKYKRIMMTQITAQEIRYVFYMSILFSDTRFKFVKSGMDNVFFEKLINTIGLESHVKLYAFYYDIKIPEMKNHRVSFMDKKKRKLALMYIGFNRRNSK